MNSVIAQNLAAEAAEPGARQRREPVLDSRAGSDRQLVALAQARAPGIEARLYDRLAPTVNRVAWALLGPDAEHDDVVHEIFIRVLRKIPGLKNPESLEQWAARIAINTTRNELRRRRLRRWVFWNAFDDPGPLIYAADLEGRELLARVHRVLDKLPPDERVILCLRLFQSETLEGVSGALGCSASTAKRRLRRARERFMRLSESDPLLRRWLEHTDPEARGDD